MLYVLLIKLHNSPKVTRCNWLEFEFEYKTDVKDLVLFTTNSNLNSVGVPSKTNPSDQNPLSLSDHHILLRKEQTFEYTAQLRENV